MVSSMGDLLMVAEKARPEDINFMARYGRGLICLTLTPDKCDTLGLRPMVRDNTSPFETAFTVSIEAKRGVTTGISAADRAHTVLTAVADTATSADLVSPGHIFPLRAKREGCWYVWVRPRVRWTWLGWQGFGRPVSSARS